MTTHYEKIQALGNRMASNLETMGVSASFGDGGLTLADKILQIQRFTNGLLLYADKSIIQIDDTVNLYALLLEDGKAISGETIKFDFGTIVSSKQVSLGDDLYDDYYVESSKTGSNYDFIGTGHSGFIQFNSSIIKTYVTSFSPEVTYNGEPFHIKNGVLTYKDTSDVERTIDVSAIDTSKAYAGAACTIHYHWIEATTGSDGVATVSYTGKGAGVLNIKAVHGIIQSETYSIIDAFFKNVGIGTDDNTNYYNPSSRVTVSVDATGKTLTQNGGTTGQYYAIPIGTTPSSSSDSSFDVDFVAEFDLVSFNEKTAYLRCGDFYRSFRNLGCTGGEHIRYEIKNGSQKIFVDNSEVPSYSGSYEMSNSNVFFTVGTDASMKFKNFIIYPI